MCKFLILLKYNTCKVPNVTESFDYPESESNSSTNTKLKIKTAQ